MRIGFIGFGLIAGSVARAVRDNPTSSSWTMSAWSPTGAGAAQAVSEGVLDHAAAEPTGVVGSSDIIVLAGPPTACLEAMDALAEAWRAALAPGAVITDVASTKGALRIRADSHGLRYVGGHPMAGLDTSGYAASRADLFTGRPWVVVPGAVAGPEDVARVSSLATACGARVIQLEAAEHDRAVAGISHLPLVLAAALVEAVVGEGTGPARPDWSTAAGLTAGGWRDMTRLARGEPSMGAGIAVTNREALAERLRDLIPVLQGWQAELERPGSPDEAAIRGRLRAAKGRIEETPQ